MITEFPWIDQLYYYSEFVVPVLLACVIIAVIDDVVSIFRGRRK